MLDSVRLKPHNEIIVAEALSNLRNYGKTAVVEPTGCGKSYVLMQLMREYMGGKIILLGPSNSLFTNLRKSKYWIDSTICHTYSYISQHNVHETFKDVGKVSMIAMDELHRAGAKQWGAATREIIKMFPDAVVVGLTATPIRYLDDRRDMVDELFDGLVAGNLSFEDAIEQGILPKPTYITGMYDIQKDIEVRLRKASKMAMYSSTAIAMIDKLKDSWTSEYVVGSMLKKYLNPDDTAVGGTKHLVFADSIETAENLAESVKRWFNFVYPNLTVRVYVAHSKRYNNKVEIRKFCDSNAPDEVDVLMSVNMINEGFHINNTSSIMMLRKTKSPTIFTQQLGRALASGGSSPYVFDLVGNYELMKVNVKEDKLELGKSRRKSKKVNHFTFSLDCVDPEDIHDETKEYSELIAKIDGLMAENFEMSLNELREALSTSGAIHAVENKELRDWGMYIQGMYFKGRLSGTKTKLFESLGDKIFITANSDNLGVDWLHTVNSISSSGEPLFDTPNGEWLIKARRAFTAGKLPTSIRKAMEARGVPLVYTDEWLNSLLASRDSEWYAKMGNMEALEPTFKAKLDITVYFMNTMNENEDMRAFRKEHFKRWKLSKGIQDDDLVNWAGKMYKLYLDATDEQYGQRLGGVDEEIFTHELLCHENVTPEIAELQGLCGVLSDLNKRDFVINHTLWGKYFDALKQAILKDTNTALVEAINKYSCYTNMESKVHDSIKTELDMELALMLRDMMEVDKAASQLDERRDLSVEAETWLVHELYAAINGNVHSMKLVDIIIDRLGMRAMDLFELAIIDYDTLGDFRKAREGDTRSKVNLQTLLSDESEYVTVLTLALGTKYEYVVAELLN